MTEERRTIDVERLVTWSLLDEAADPGASVESLLVGGGSNAASVAAFGARGGVLIDGGRHAWLAGARSDQDALVVWGVISGLEPMARSLVIYHGRLGSRPDPMVGAVPRLGPRLDDRDRPALSPGYDRSRNELPRYCHLVEEVTAEEIRRAWATWSVWRGGLVIAATVLASARLRRWSVVGPSAPLRPCEPWEVDELERRFEPPAQAYPDHASRAGAVHWRNRPPAGAGSRRYELPTATSRGRGRLVS